MCFTCLSWCVMYTFLGETFCCNCDNLLSNCDHLKEDLGCDVLSYPRACIYRKGTAEELLQLYAQDSQEIHACMPSLLLGKHFVVIVITCCLIVTTSRKTWDVMYCPTQEPVSTGKGQLKNYYNCMHRTHKKFMHACMPSLLLNQEWVYITHHTAYGSCFSS